MYIVTYIHIYIHNTNIDVMNDMLLTLLNQINKCDNQYTEYKKKQEETLTSAATKQ